MNYKKRINDDLVYWYKQGLGDGVYVGGDNAFTGSSFFIAGSPDDKIHLHDALVLLPPSMIDGLRKNANDYFQSLATK